MPSIASLSPASITQESAAFILTVNGSDFVAGSTVQWNGNPIVTDFVGDAQLTAQIPAEDISSVGTADVAVSNPLPGGGTSSAISFSITLSNPVPSISALAPSSAAVGGKAFTLTVDGSDFASSSGKRLPISAILKRSVATGSYYQ